jgi:KDO2-lipid IV(A) lauroyltransferase
MKIKTRRYYIYYILKLVFFMIGLLPLRVSTVMAGYLGRLAFYMVPRHSKTAVENLNSALGKNDRENATIARQMFENFAKNGAEWIKMASMDPSGLDELVAEFRGLENIKDVLAGGKGVVALAGHFGNWELISIYLRQKGYSGAVVARRLYFDKYDSFITSLRARFGVSVIYRDESPKKILRVLRDGGILGILADQDIKNIDGVFVDFFGRPAFTPTAPVKLAMASKTDIVPVFAIRRKDNKHILVAEKPIRIDHSLKSEEAVRGYMQAWSNVFEDYVRKYPEQWVWVHKRWKTRNI